MFESFDILRSGFVVVDDDVHSFATVTYRKGSVKLPWKTFPESSVDKLKLKASSSVFENYHLPPWRLFFFKSALGENHLLFSGHHALYDATSLKIIFQDVAAHYNGSETIERRQFVDVLDTITQHTIDPLIVESDRMFWLQQLEGSSVFRMPNLCPVRVVSTSYHVKELDLAWGLLKIESRCPCCLPNGVKR